MNRIPAAPVKPKKKGPFFFFMRERKREMEETGSKFPRGYPDVIDLVGKEWEGMSQEARKKYVIMAQQNNEGREKNPPHPISVLANNLKLRSEENKLNKDEGEQHVLEVMKRCDAKVMPIVIVNFSVYWEMTNTNGTMAIPAEVGLAVFSLKEGVYDNMSCLIDPGEITKEDSYNYKIAADVKKSVKLKKLPEPNYYENFQNCTKILEGIQKFVNSHSGLYFGEPYLFCLDSEYCTVNACLDWLCRRSDRMTELKILSLNVLMQLMSRETRCLKEDGSSSSESPHGNNASSTAPIDQEKLSSALAKKKKIANIVYPHDLPLVRKGIFMDKKDVDEFLFSRNYAYHGELACVYHMQLDDAVHHCSQTKVNRYAYCLLDSMIEGFDVIPEPGWHYPMLDNMELQSNLRRELMSKWEIGDSSFVVYLEFLKNVEEGLYTKQFEDLDGVGREMSRTEKKIQNFRARVGNRDGRTFGGGPVTPDGFEVVSSSTVQFMSTDNNTRD